MIPGTPLILISRIFLKIIFQEEPKEDTTDKPKKGKVRNGLALNKGNDDPLEEGKPTVMPAVTGVSPVTPGFVTIPAGDKDIASNPWWDAVHGITPEKLDHLITAINEMNELFGT